MYIPIILYCVWVYGYDAFAPAKLSVVILHVLCVRRKTYRAQHGSHGFAGGYYIWVLCSAVIKLRPIVLIYARLWGISCMGALYVYKCGVRRENNRLLFGCALPCAQPRALIVLARF